jgi:hypothetical protein
VGREVHNRVYVVFAQGLFKQREIGQVTVNEVCPGVNRCSVAFVEVIIDDDLMPCVAQLLYSHTADVARATCHEYALELVHPGIKLFKPTLGGQFPLSHYIIPFCVQ